MKPEDMVMAAVRPLLLKDGDYVQNGLYFCGQCHTPKQYPLPINGKSVLVPCLCDCGKVYEEERQREEMERKRNTAIEIMRETGMREPAYRSMTFQKDDARDKAVSNTCRRYVEHFAEMEDNNIGIQMIGPVGSGKTFFACAIANALIDRGIPAIVTSIPEILQEAKNFGTEIETRLHGYPLAVIDDFGVERCSDYGMEVIYRVINTRYLAHKPTIITSNLQIGDTADIRMRRIYDRIEEMAPIKLTVKEITTRRAENSSKRLNIARKIIGGKS